MTESRGGLWFGALFSAFWGVLCVLVALDLVDWPARVPRWLLFMIGVVILLVALYLVSIATGGEQRRAGVDVFLRVWIGPIAIGLLAVTSVWIGFGPGERQHGSGPLRALFGPRVGAIETRVVFGAAGIGLSLLAIYAFRSTWRSQRGKDGRDANERDATQ